MMAVTSTWGGDLVVGPTGDIDLIAAEVEVQQRIIRRLLTNPGDYIWHTNYGAGLGRYIGETNSADYIQSVVSAQLRGEVLVSSTPPPRIQVDQSSMSSASATTLTIEFQAIGSSGTDVVVMNLSVHST